MITIFIRAIIIYALVIFCLRLMGKRQLGELQPSELVITILISNIASLPIEDPSTPLVMGLIPIFALVGFELLVSHLSLRNHRFRKLISGSPIVIINHGTVIQSAMREIRFSSDDLLESLRAQGVFDISEVQYAIVETTGQVSVLQKKTTDTKVDLNPPVIVISEGVFHDHTLQQLSIDRPYIDVILTNQQCTVKDVFLLSMNSNLQYHLIKKENPS